MRKTGILNEARQTDPLCKAPLIELTGENRVLMENHHGILAYSTEEIKVKVSFGCIVVLGERLFLRELSKEQLVIWGRIDSVRLVRR